eukprot:SAG31_NODE_4536_length_3157_cov_5.125899_4_plen_69_part_00
MQRIHNIVVRALSYVTYNHNDLIGRADQGRCLLTDGYESQFDRPGISGMLLVFHKPDHFRRVSFGDPQ